MKYKTFKYKKYKNCWFEVGNYPRNPEAMLITINSESMAEPQIITVNMPDYMYDENTATIKNYSENSGITDFLIDLDIIDYIYSKKQSNICATKGETIDYCEINIEEIKKYSKKFNYKFIY